MQLTSEQSTEEIIRQARTTQLMRVAAYGIIIALAYFLITVPFKTPIILIHDAGVYLRAAERIKQQGLFAFYDDVRTYGYPLFLATVQQSAAIFAPFIHWSEVIVFVQFLLHTGTAWLSVALLSRLDERAKLSFTRRLTCFALVEFNAVLLGLTRDILSDSITVFRITLFLLLVISSIRFKWFFTGLLYALATVVRPFNQVWGLLFLVILVFLLIVRQTVLYGRAQTPTKFRQIIVKRAALISLQFVFPVLLIIGLQYYSVYRVENRYNLVGKLALEFAAQHLESSVYTYKYETFIGSDPRPPQMWYRFAQGAKQATLIEDAQGNLNSFRYFLTYPLDTAYTFIVKAVGLFQQYEWSTYRLVVVNLPGVVFLWGLVPLIALVYAHWYAFLNIHRMFTTGETTFYQLIVLAAADLYLLLYTVFTIPESRFLAPVLPSLTVSELAVVSKKDQRSLIFFGILTFALYLLTFQILRESMT